MTPDNQPNEIVIVRRKAAWEEEGGQHGVWKIAYADFMTAMMAFFLVMWLINVTDDSVRRGVAQYFNPVKLASTAPNQKGLNDPNVAGDTNENGADQPEGDLGAGGAPEGGSEANGAQGAEVSAGRFAASHSEERLFNDPYAVLDTLAQTVAVDLGDVDMPTAIGAGQAREAGAQGGDAFRDPFDPLYWQFLPNRDLGSERTGGEQSTQPRVIGGLTPTPAADPSFDRQRHDNSAIEIDEGSVPEILAHFDGGEGEFEETEFVAAGETNELYEISEEALEDSMTAVASRVEAVLDQAAESGLGATVDHVSVSRSDEGLLISLTDDQAFGMFAIGSAEPRPELVALLGRIGKELAGADGAIVIKGHTDARPYRTKAYDNWRLSSARAHMALYMLARGGVSTSRFERVEGYADRDLKLPAAPKAAANRRVEILIRETD
ncbi:MotB family protein [Roseibium sp.]|uniref:MotB family protein n=2 Tax=Roseibium sp. TaxID=1936156 RepID=UPI003266617B